MSWADAGLSDRLAADAGHPLPTVVPPAELLLGFLVVGSRRERFGLAVALDVFVGVMLFAAGANDVQRRFSAAGVPD